VRALRSKDYNDADRLQGQGIGFQPSRRLKRLFVCGTVFSCGFLFVQFSSAILSAPNSKLCFSIFLTYGCIKSCSDRLLQNALTDAREDLANLRKSAHVASEQVSTLQSENSKLRGNLAQSETLLKGEKVRTGELEQLLERVLQKRADSEQENRVLKQELEAVKLKVAQADARVEQLTSQADKREEAKQRADQNGAECAERLEEARTEVNSLAQLLASAEEELRELDTECAGLSEQRAHWEEAATEAQRQLSTTKLNLKDVGTKLRFESNQRSGLEKENGGLRQENLNLDGSLKTAKESVTEMERRLSECREELLSARAEVEGVKCAVEWAERRADEAKRAADVAAERVTSEQLTAQKLSTEVEAWRSRHVALEAEVAGHVAEKEQQLEAAVRREVAMREEFEERERRLVAKVEGKERDLLEAREKAQVGCLCAPLEMLKLEDCRKDRKVNGMKTAGGRSEESKRSPANNTYCMNIEGNG
jgi:chromosome segregation ATPase